MRELLRHRGPDDAGLWIDGDVGLGHRRLSIIDLSPAGRQPLCNEDGSIWVTYNGEIYNYRELRRELLNRGHTFRTATDSEVLVHLYEERGQEMVHSLRGMFAFAIWDRRRRLLLLARDRMGIKPLYYAHVPTGDLAFASEIKSVLASALVEARAHPPALVEYLANRYTTGSQTLAQGVLRLPPAHIAVWQAGDLSLSRYWKLPTGDAVPRKGADIDWVEEFREKFAESVKLRMISDAPIGVFLSGGVDSSAITAVMSQNSAGPVRSFSVAFNEGEANEVAYARQVAEAFGTVHSEVVVTPAEFFDALPRLVWHEDEPIAFPSSVPLYFVSRLAAHDVKVVLTGEGSDELLAGYGKYWRALYNLRAASVYSLLPGGVRGSVRQLIDRLPAGRLAHWIGRTFLHQPNTIEGLYLDNFSVFGNGRQRRLFKADFLAELTRGNGEPQPYAGHRSEFDSVGDGPLLNRLLALDQLTYLQKLLMKQDRMSMAASLESRVPFLDHELVELVARMPLEFKLRRLETKRVLRLAMRDVLPRPILRRSKMGFPTPVGAWFRSTHQELLDDLVLSRRVRDRGIVDVEAVEQLVREHREGSLDHTERLWALLNLELWFRSFVDRSSEMQVS